MNRRSVIRVIAAIGLLLGQWTAVIHAAQHDANLDLKTSCEICAIAHVGGGTPATVLVPVQQLAARDPLPASPARSPAAKVYPRPYGTGPPAVLV